MADPSIDEIYKAFGSYVQRVEAGLAEVGYPNAICMVTDLYIRPFDHVPDVLGWTAMEVAGERPCPQHRGVHMVRIACWPCWNAAGSSRSEVAHDCSHGRCHNPDADRWPPSELLRGPGLRSIENDSFRSGNTRLRWADPA